jgi:exonuclease VII small subunit
VVLASFLVGAALAIGGGTFAAVRGIRLWRQTKRTGGALVRELASFEERSARSERHLAEWERSNAALEVALERLRASRARLQVLQNALAQAQARVRWLRVFLPR